PAARRRVRGPAGHAAADPVRLRLRRGDRHAHRPAGPGGAGRAGPGRPRRAPPPAPGHRGARPDVGADHADRVVPAAPPRAGDRAGAAVVAAGPVPPGRRRRRAAEPRAGDHRARHRRGRTPAAGRAGPEPAGDAGMRVLMNAGPWLPVPPHGYGGIENVVATLVPELRRLGVHVVLATVGDSELAVDERVSVFPTGQFAALQRPYNQVCGIVPAHLHGLATALRARDDIDLVHNHVEAAGLATMATLGADAPPTLHTLHWDLSKHAELYGS